APYSLSKFQAEKGLLRLADGAFSPVILRKGTVHGFSPRMRYDLVLNTFVKDALSKGRLTLYNRGLVWRPVIDIRDVALAYIFLLEADEEKVRGQIFNLALKNIQIKDLAAKTKEVFSELRLPLSIKLKTTRRQRTYQISTRKINNLGWKPIFSLETSIRDLIKKISEKEYSDFENPIYYNIIWVKQRLGW
ncbi:MAG TPA: SDR family NAD-dependent epimerase/dehydratase, partial [Thermoplasmata archaeon]|nr:SDR family NAD-dependent epimerase/dehydratase [Thermoplasmata archaeon]